jgi:hypothetical protein
MPELEGPAVDPTMRRPARTWWRSSDLAEPIPPAPAPTWAIDPGADAPVIEVVLGRAITREVIGSIETAVVEDWVDDVEFLVTQTASIRASSWDPIWPLAGTLIGISADGHPVYEWDPKGFIVWIEVDGAAVWTGMFRSPINIGGGTMVLPAVDPGAICAERILGRPEQLDLLEDRGSFEQYSSVGDMIADGWQFDEGVTPSLVTTDAVRGTKALRVTGKGWWSSPKVTLEGADGYGRTVEGACFARFNDAIEPNTEVVRTRAVRIGNSAEDVTYRNNRAGGRPGAESGWSDGPITSGARMQPVVASHRCWVQGRSYTGFSTDYDLVTLRQGVTTGAPPGSTQDLSWYFERVWRDLNARSLGGSPTGLSVRATDCGTTATGKRWAHNQRTKVGDVLAMILERDGAPEARITPGWWIEVGPRLGADRTDLAITTHDLVDPGWQVDPGAQVDDYVVDTGIGSGTSWVSVTVSQPEVSDRHRIIALVTAPPDRTLNELQKWADAHARAAARIHITKTAVVPWELGMAIDAGDTIPVVDHDGHLGLDRTMRVVARRPLPTKMLVELGLGATDA